MDSLPMFLRLNGQPVILLGNSDAADAKRRLLERAGAKPVGECGEAKIAIVAVEEEEEARAAVARLKARGILVNATDRPELCDFTMPAIVDRDPVMVAIGTGGASAGLAKALRIAIEAMLPANLGGLALGLFAARDHIHARWPDARDRRNALDAALAPGGALDPLSGADAAAIAHWLDAEALPSLAAVEHLQLRSSDPDDLTLREARLLGRADLIVHRDDVPAVILNRARADAVRVVGDRAPEGSRKGLTLLIGWKA